MCSGVKEFPSLVNFCTTYGCGATGRQSCAIFGFWPYQTPIGWLHLITIFLRGSPKGCLPAAEFSCDFWHGSWGLRLCVFGGLCRHVTIGTPMVIFPVLTVFWLFLTVFDDWYTNGHFCPFYCLLTVVDCFWRLVHCWYTKDSQNRKNDYIGVPIVTSLPRLYQQCTNRQKQSKDSQNSKNDRWCTNRHMSTQSPPNTQSPRPRPHSRPPNTQSQDSQTSPNFRLWQMAIPIQNAHTARYI